MVVQTLIVQSEKPKANQHKKCLKDERKSVKMELLL